MPLFAVTRCYAALKTHRRTCMVKSSFNKAESSRPKAYCYTINKMFAILAFSFMSDNVIVFTSCKP